jgi:hypothetical protein
MPRNREILFPTFVLACALSAIVALPTAALAAKTTPSPDFDAPEKTQAPESKADDISRETVDIAQPPPLKEPLVSEREFFYQYRQAITIHAGEALSSVTTNDTSMPLVAGIQYEYMTQERKTYEVGADLLSDGTGTLDFAKRWIYTRTRLRPYTKAGGGLLVKPSDGLAALVNFVNFRVEGAAGAEYLLRKSQSIRADLKAALSTKAFVVIGTFGYVWAW